MRRALQNNVPLLFVSLICFHDDIIMIKMCNRANPSQVGFVHMFEHCFLLTHDFFFVTCLCHSMAKSWHFSSGHSNKCKFSKWLMSFWTAVKGNKCLHYSIAFAVQFSSFPHHHHSSKTGLIVSMYDPLISDVFNKKPAFGCYDMASLVWICAWAE